MALLRVEHVQKFNGYLNNPKTHPDYNDWCHKFRHSQASTSKFLNQAQFLLKLELEWEKYVNNIIDVQWERKIMDFGKTVQPKPFKAQRRRYSSSSSSSSSFSSSSDDSRSRRSKKKLKKKKKKSKYSNSDKPDLRSFIEKSKNERVSPSDSKSPVRSMVSQRELQHRHQHSFSAARNNPSSNVEAKYSTYSTSDRHAAGTSWNMQTQPTLAPLQPAPLQIPPDTQRNPYERSCPAAPFSVETGSHCDTLVSSTSDRSSGVRGLIVMEILKLLVQVRGKAGVVGETLPLVLNRVERSIARGARDIACFSSDDLVLFMLIRNKLVENIILPSVSFVEKVIVEEAINQMDELTNMIKSFLSSSESMFNLTILAQKTDRMPIKESMAYIKEMLIEFNRPHTENDILPIFVDLVKFRGGL